RRRLALGHISRRARGLPAGLPGCRFRLWSVQSGGAGADGAAAAAALLPVPTVVRREEPARTAEDNRGAHTRGARHRTKNGNVNRAIIEEPQFDSVRMSR